MGYTEPKRLTDRIAFHVAKLQILEHMSDDELVTCPVCDGDPVASVREDMCNCGGKSTVRDAKLHHEAELDILSK